MKKSILISIFFLCSAANSFADAPVVSADQEQTPVVQQQTTTTTEPTANSEEAKQTNVPQLPVAPAEKEAIYFTDKLKIIPKTDNEEDATIPYNITATYPQIDGEGIEKNSHAQAFNKIMSTMATQEIAQFKQYVALDRVHMQTLPEDMRKNTLKMDYDVDIVKSGKDSIISVRLSIEGYQGGHAHPYHAYRVLNFDLANNKELTLSDIFKRKNYLNTLAKISQKKLNASLQDKWMIAEGTKPLPKNFKNWNLQTDSILITFDEYQVAPYANGVVEVEIPYGELKEMIAASAPIYPCVRHLEVCTGEKGKG